MKRNSSLLMKATSPTITMNVRATNDLGAALLAVYGGWQCEGEVRHIVAQRLVDMSHLLGGLNTVSRNSC
jgi:hypothetical protein